MPARLLTGKEPAEALLASLKPRILTLHPSLVIVQVGDDPASNAYIKAKTEACERIGIHCAVRQWPPGSTSAELLDIVNALNVDPAVSGYILQLPLPDHLWKELPQIVATMDPQKDVDGFTATNLGNLLLSQESRFLPPATPAGIMMLLDHYGIDVAGRHAIVIGRSTLVGRPLAIMLLHRDATVTICHSHTTDLAAYTRSADILLSAVGKPGLITAAMVKPGAVVVDIGITRLRSESSGGQARLVGDVDFDATKDIASAITPVPGGVGPMTVASLLNNVVRAKEWQALSSSPPSPSSAEPQ